LYLQRPSHPCRALPPFPPPPGKQQIRSWPLSRPSFPVIFFTPPPRPFTESSSKGATFRAFFVLLFIAGGEPSAGGIGNHSAVRTISLFQFSLPYPKRKFRFSDMQLARKHRRDGRPPPFPISSGYRRTPLLLCVVPPQVEFKMRSLVKLICFLLRQLVAFSFPF